MLLHSGLYAIPITKIFFNSFTWTNIFMNSKFHAMHGPHWFRFARCHDQQFVALTDRSPQHKVLYCNNPKMVHEGFAWIYYQMGIHIRYRVLFRKMVQMTHRIAVTNVVQLLTCARNGQRREPSTSFIFLSVYSLIQNILLFSQYFKLSCTTRLSSSIVISYYIYQIRFNLAYKLYLY